MTRRIITFILATIAVTLLLAPGVAWAANTDFNSSIVAGGLSHSLALDEDGTVWAWGSNQELQLGQPASVKESSVPLQVGSLSSIIAVAAGHDFSVALRYDGQVCTWGAGKNSEPTLVPGIDNVVAIAAGQGHVLALRSDGTVWQWRAGSVPRIVSNLQGVAAISAGSSHYLALTCGGEVWAWGSNWSGQVGDGTTTDASFPVKVEGLSNVVSIAAGHSHSLAATYSGTVYAWGSNSYGQLGNDTSEDSTRPVKTSFPNSISIVAVSAGSEASLAISTKNDVYAWGYGEYGQLGVEKPVISQLKPQQITSRFSSNVAYIASGVHHCLAVTNKGELYGWGRNKNYQLGLEENTNINTAQLVMSKVLLGSVYKVNNIAQASRWAQEELLPLYERYVVPPVLWGDYQTNITRGEFAHMLVAVYEQIKDRTAGTNRSRIKFEDIANHAYETDIVKAFNLELINGLSDAVFAPNQTITRQEAAKMLCGFVAKMEQVEIPDTVASLSYFNDARVVSDWAIPYVAYAYQNDIMRGVGDGFDPLGNITKEQSLLVMARMFVQYEWQSRP